MSLQDKWLSVADLRGGRNGIDPPISLRDVECVEAVNVDWHNALLARKRKGAAAMSPAPPSLNFVTWLGRHVPSSDETAAELWASDNAGTMARCAAGVWSTPSAADGPTGPYWDISAVSLNGLYFLAYKSAQGRLHVWDGTSVRRTGLSVLPGGVLTTANTGAGAYAAITRYYRHRLTVQVGGVTVRRSEPSGVVVFTPSGAGAGVLITRPAGNGEGETHWEVEASTDAANFYVIGTTAFATATFTDNIAPATYATTYTLSASIGTYNYQTSYRFIAADQNRLLGFGSYVSTDAQNTIGFSAVVGDKNVGDAERVPIGNTLTLDENDSGEATGLVGPVNGSYFAFKYRQVWKLTPTGNVVTPYARVCLSKHIGAINSRSITVAEDENGNPAIYWMSHRGPYRFGSNGLEYIGKGIEDQIALLNLAADVSCHALFVPDLRQVWFYIATWNTVPDTKLVWNTGRSGGTAVSDHPVPSGWAVHTGPSALALASVMFANTIGATVSRDLKPYIAHTGAVNTILKCDTGTDDNGTAFQAYVTTKVYYPWGLHSNGNVRRCYLLAQAAAGVSIRLTITPDYDSAQARSFDVSLAPAATETRLRRRFEDAAMAGAAGVQFTIGDAAAVSNAWQLDALMCEVLGKETA